MKHARYSPDVKSDETQVGTHTRDGSASLICCQCGATQTPQWREGPEGPKTLCNACGVKWYRQAKRRKGGVHSAARSSQQRQHRPLPKPGRVTGDSGDELTVAYCMMSDHSEDSEEQLAALSLLSFAGVQHQGLDSADGEDGEAAEPEPLHLIQADLVMGSAPDQSVANMLSFVTAQVPAPELSCLQQLQAAVRQAFREVQAADAATVAVAQFLHEKEVQARCARERARLAERMLLEQMKQLDLQYQLTRQRCTP